MWSASLLCGALFLAARGSSQTDSFQALIDTPGEARLAQLVKGREGILAGFGAWSFEVGTDGDLKKSWTMNTRLEGESFKFGFAPTSGVYDADNKRYLICGRAYSSVNGTSKSKAQGIVVASLEEKKGVAETAKHIVANDAKDAFDLSCKGIALTGASGLVTVVGSVLREGEEEGKQDRLMVAQLSNDLETFNWIAQFTVDDNDALTGQSIAAQSSGDTVFVSARRGDDEICVAAVSSAGALAWSAQTKCVGANTNAGSTVLSGDAAGDTASLYVAATGEDGWVGKLSQADGSDQWSGSWIDYAEHTVLGAGVGKWDGSPYLAVARSGQPCGESTAVLDQWKLDASDVAAQTPSQSKVAMNATGGAFAIAFVDSDSAKKGREGVFAVGPIESLAYDELDGNHAVVLVRHSGSGECLAEVAGSCKMSANAVDATVEDKTVTPSMNLTVSVQDVILNSHHENDVETEFPCGPKPKSSSNDSDHSKIAMALGIFVPVALCLLGVYAWYCCRKGPQVSGRQGGYERA